MDFNTILTRFGFDSSNFVNKPVNAIEFEGGFIYEVATICLATFNALLNE